MTNTKIIQQQDQPDIDFLDFLNPYRLQAKQPTDSTLTVLWLLNDLANQVTPAKGLAYEALLHKCRLDYSINSLKRIDKLLDYIRTKQSPSIDDFFNNTQKRTFLYLLAFYCGEMRGRMRKVAPIWSFYDEFIEANEGMEQIIPPSVSTQWICKFVTEDEQIDYFMPLVSILVRLFDEHPDKSTYASTITSSASKLDADTLLPEPPASRLAFDMQQALKKMPAQYLPYLQMLPPLWMTDDPLMGQIKDLEVLYNTGRVVWGTLVQANNGLFEDGSPTSYPAEVLYDVSGRSSPQALKMWASELFDLKNTKPDDPELLEYVNHISAENTRLYTRIPKSISPLPVYSASIFIWRAHLPNGTLTLPYFPLLISDDSQFVAILPAYFWSDSMLYQWWVDTQNEANERIKQEQAIEAQNKPPVSGNSPSFNVEKHAHQGFISLLKEDKEFWSGYQELLYPQIYDLPELGINDNLAENLENDSSDELADKLADNLTENVALEADRTPVEDAPVETNKAIEAAEDDELTFDLSEFDDIKAELNLDDANVSKPSANKGDIKEESKNYIKRCRNSATSDYRRWVELDDKPSEQEIVSGVQALQSGQSSHLDANVKKYAKLILRDWQAYLDTLASPLNLPSLPNSRPLPKVAVALKQKRLPPAVIIKLVRFLNQQGLKGVEELMTAARTGQDTIQIGTQNNTTAMLYLAYIYATGKHGIVQSIREASVWLNYASGLGDYRATRAQAEWILSVPEITHDLIGEKLRTEASEHMLPMMNELMQSGNYMELTKTDEDVEAYARNPEAQKEIIRQKLKLASQQGDTTASARLQQLINEQIIPTHPPSQELIDIGAWVKHALASRRNQQPGTQPQSNPRFGAQFDTQAQQPFQANAHQPSAHQSSTKKTPSHPSHHLNTDFKEHKSTSWIVYVVIFFIAITILTILGDVFFGSDRTTASDNTAETNTASQPNTVETAPVVDAPDLIDSQSNLPDNPDTTRPTQAPPIDKQLANTIDALRPQLPHTLRLASENTVIDLQQSGLDVTAYIESSSPAVMAIQSAEYLACNEDLFKPLWQTATSITLDISAKQGELNYNVNVPMEKCQ